MAEREMPSQSGNARTFSIAADVGETTVDLRLPDSLPKGRGPEGYKVVKKDLPDAARGKTYNGKTVKWINTFGVRLRGKFKTKSGADKDDPFYEEVDGEQFSYEVIVPGSTAPKDLPTLVYFDGTNVQPANAVQDSNGNYKFSLGIGDPPTGWGG